MRARIRLYVVRPSTQATRLQGILYEGASRLIRLCGDASYEHRAQQPDPGMFRPLVLTSFANTGVNTVYVGYHAPRNYSQSRLLPLQSARLLWLANYWEESRQSSLASSRLSLLSLGCSCHHFDERPQGFSSSPSSRPRKGTIFLCSWYNAREATANHDRR